MGGESLCFLNIETSLRLMKIRATHEINISEKDAREFVVSFLEDRFKLGRGFYTNTFVSEQNLVKETFDSRGKLIDSNVRRSNESEIAAQLIIDLLKCQNKKTSKKSEI